MKKYILIALAALATTGAADAQENQWHKKSAPVTISFIHKTRTVDSFTGFDPTEHAGLSDPQSFTGNGVGLAKMRTFYFGDKDKNVTVRAGLDVTWMDMRVVMYKKGNGIFGNVRNQLGIVQSACDALSTGKTYAGMADLYDAVYTTATDFDDLSTGHTIDAEKINLGVFDFGYYMGIGPSVKIIPPSLDGKVKASAYVHYKPGVEVCAVTGVGSDPQVQWAPVLNNFAIGANFASKRFGVGVEYSFGKANFDAYQYDDKMVKVGTVTNKLNALRVYLGLRF